MINKKINNAIIKSIFVEENEQIEKMKNHQKHELNRFRKYAEERLNRFRKDEKRLFMQFQPLDKMYRTIV